MNKYLVPIAAVLGAALVAFAPFIQTLISTHPALTGLFAALAAVAAAFAPQPQKP